MPTVVVCPPLDGEEAPPWVGRPQGAMVIPPAGGIDWVAHTALALRHLPDDVVVVVIGRACELAPRLGFAARAARRPITAYVLVGGPLPSAEHRTSDWPDAPVTFVGEPDSPEGRDALRRGWQVTERGHWTGSP